MMQSNRAGRIWRPGILMLLLLALTGCSGPRQTVVLPEARTVKINQGEPAPFTGWLMTDSAAAKLLEAAERCSE